jgi:hypothetical protein
VEPEDLPEDLPNSVSRNSGWGESSGEEVLVWERKLLQTPSSMGKAQMIINGGISPALPSGAQPLRRSSLGDTGEPHVHFG